jgi:hypothetical protein
MYHLEKSLEQTPAAYIQVRHTWVIMALYCIMLVSAGYYDPSLRAFMLPAGRHHVAGRSDIFGPPPQNRFRFGMDREMEKLAIMTLTDQVPDRAQHLPW